MRLSDFINQYQLPLDYTQQANTYFYPLAKQCIRWYQQHGQTVIIGLNGCQGSGKTTLAAYLVMTLESLGYTAVSLSIDDFYYSKSQRQQLANSIHPLLQTRGVPGTHNVDLAQQTLDALKRQLPCHLPRFDKSHDDCQPRSNWSLIDKPINVVIFEGWCVGIQPQSKNALKTPINTLEQQHDKDGRWRHYVNQQLATRYTQLWYKLDHLLMLKAPSFDVVYTWRQQQETQLRQRLQKNHVEHSAVMSDIQLQTFIHHYERLTRHALKTLAADSDIIFYLNKARMITSATSQPHNLP